MKIRYSVSTLLIAVLTTALLSPAALAARYDAEEKDIALEARIQQLESLTQNGGMFELIQRIEQLQQDMQEMRGTLEQLGNDVEGIKKRQRSLYLDMDRRLNDLQLSGGKPAPLVSAPGTDASSTPSANNSAAQASATLPATAAQRSGNNIEQERQSYEAAFKYLREGRYPQAIDHFKQFLKKYPDGRYAGNSQYWLGEANYVSRDFDQALTEFLVVLDKYSHSSKVPDTKLKLGYTYYELKQWERAREMLNDVLQHYPSSSVAPLAQKRLIRMTEEGH